MNGLKISGPKAYSYLRMSTDIQRKGDSRRRQLEKSIGYAKANGLELADESQLEDIGVSAFKGDNVKGGSLGQFLDAVEKGRVPAGSYLLVESLDRLSRQEVLKSLTLFLRIVQSGINLVTLEDQRVYRAQNTDYIDLIVSLTIMSRAHEESQLKSQRVGAAWANKRTHANLRPMTKVCPAWLRLAKDRSCYEEIQEKANVVRSIFEDTVAGIGSYVITNRLNKKRVPTFGRSKYWQRSYIAKILSSRAVLGEYQPCKISAEGKREPVGLSIQDYYRRLIPDELFYRAQQARSQRRVDGRGRKGKYVSNLFSGIAECAYCHHPMVFENKGRKGGTFLVCSRAKRGLGCVTTRWRYDHFEASFLAFVEQLDLPTLIRDDDSKKKALDEAIQALQGELVSLRDEMERAYQLLKLNPSLDFVAEKLGPLQKRVQELDAQLKEKETERQSLEASESELYQSKAEIKSLIARLQTPAADEDDLYKLRSQVAARIKAIVKALIVAPLGEAPRSEMLWRDMEAMAEGPAELAEIAELKRTVVDRRYFGVGFTNGHTLHIHPNKDEPLKFDRKTVDLMTSYGPDGELVPPPQPRR